MKKGLKQSSKRDFPKRYTLLMNSYLDVRVSKCPQCKKSTYPRKFPLAIDFRDVGMIVLGKTGPYCPRCELIVVHQHDLEAELLKNPFGLTFEQFRGNYFVFGVVPLKFWRANMKAPKDPDSDDPLANLTIFKKYLDLHVEPGGWFPAEK